MMPFLDQKETFSFDMDMSYAWVLLLKVAHRNLTVYVTRYGVRAHNVVHGTSQRSHCSVVASVVEKIKCGMYM
jgi:hypothetical protein